MGNAEDPCMNENAPAGERVVTMHLLAERTSVTTIFPEASFRLPYYVYLTDK